MARSTSRITHFMRGIASYAAILPSFFTSYPYHHEDRSLTYDWANIGDDLNIAIEKFDDKRV